MFSKKRRTKVANYRFLKYTILNCSDRIPRLILLVNACIRSNLDRNLSFYISSIQLYIRMIMII